MYALVLVLIIIIVILSAAMWKIFLSADDMQDTQTGKQGRTSGKDESKRKVRRQA